MNLNCINIKLILLMLLLTQTSNSLAQNKVVVVPLLGSDVSSADFNDLVAAVNQQRVYSGTVTALGFKEGGGYFTSSQSSGGIYNIRVIPAVRTFNYGKPSVVVTSIDLARVATIKSVSLELIDDQILYVDFIVELRTTSLFLSNSKFSFQLKFAESNPNDIFSDKRLKTNIKPIATTAGGFKLYQFNYKESSDQQTYVGIMAQDIIAQHPQAISIDQQGYYRVNYTMLGLKMATLEDWLALGQESVVLDSNLAGG